MNTSSKPEALERGVMFGYPDTWKPKQQRQKEKERYYNSQESDPDSLITRVSRLTLRSFS